MQDFNTLTNADILALTDVQIETYIDLACAEAGAPFVPPEPTEPVKPVAEPDLTLYKVGSIVFKDAEVANRLLETVASSQVYEDTYNVYATDTKTVKPIGPGDYSYPKVETLRGMSPTRHAECKQALELYTAAKKKYDEEKKAYDRAVEMRGNIAADIRDRVYEAIAARDLRERLRADFRRYLDLADGNTEIAARFFQKAYPDYDLNGEYGDIKTAAVAA